MDDFRISALPAAGRYSDARRMDHLSVAAAARRLAGWLRTVFAAPRMILLSSILGIIITWSIFVRTS
jgi:hypothetical protein